MKKIMIYFLLLIMPATSFCQQTKESTPAVNTDYLKKSKNQKTTAWVLLSGGFVLTAAGVIVGLNEVSEDIENIFVPGDQRSSNAGAVLFFAGSASMLGSIPFFISSSKNKKRAMQASTGLKIERSSSVYGNSLVQNCYPAVSLKLNLAK
jgi:hypothetical protein